MTLSFFPTKKDYIHAKAVKFKNGVLWDEYKFLQIIQEVKNQQKLYYNNDITGNANNR